MADGRAIKFDVKARRIILTDKPKILAGEKGHTPTFKEGVNCTFLDVEPFSDISTADAIFDTGVKKFTKNTNINNSKKPAIGFAIYWQA